MVLVVALLCAIPGLIFSRLGAWPIMGFMGLDILGIYLALTWSLRDGRRYEEVTLWADALEIRRVDPKGGDSRETFNPFYVRLEVDRDDEDRTTALRLRSRRHAIEIGAFLNPDDKATFAAAFGDALRHARR